MVRPHEAVLTGVAGEQASSDLAVVLGVLRRHAGDAGGLVVGQRVHRVEDQRLDSRLARRALPTAVIEHREQERLRLTRAGAGGDDRRLGLMVFAGQPRERRRLVPIGLEAVRDEVEMVLPALARQPERQSQPQERAGEDAGFRVVEESLQALAGVVIGEFEGGGEVGDQSLLEFLGQEGGQHARAPVSGSFGVLRALSSCCPAGFVEHRVNLPHPSIGPLHDRANLDNSLVRCRLSPYFTDDQE